MISLLYEKACNWASEASPTLGYSIEISRDWASEASPTLGCSIEILRDIIMCIVGRGPKSVGGMTCAHAQSQYWAVKSDQ